MTTEVQYQLDTQTKWRLANEACSRAREYAPKKTGKGARGLYPFVTDDAWGVGVREGVYYMHYQNDGTKPFIMRSLEGKVIPMQIGGQTVFRKAVNVGGHQIEKRDPRTGRILTGNRPIKWRHPGLKGKHFIEEAIQDTIIRNQGELVRVALSNQLQDLFGKAV